MTKDCNKLGNFQLSGIPPAPRGVPQIEVTYDVDANGILNVSAVEKAGGKSQKITIASDTKRSAEEIERMVKEAEGFKADDNRQRERVEAKNGLEGYAFQVKQSLDDEQLASKVTDDDKAAVEAKVGETLAWLDANQTAEKDEFEPPRKVHRHPRPPRAGRRPAQASAPPLVPPSRKLTRLYTRVTAASLAGWLKPPRPGCSSADSVHVAHLRIKVLR